MTQHAPAERRRVTITDIAAAAGVSKGTVSYALNDRPGVSAATRQRVRAVADDLGWLPNSAARALSGHDVDACGLVVNRPARTLALEPFFMELISGIEVGFSQKAVGLMLQMVEAVEDEVDVYRRWAAERRVDGVLVVDLQVDDERVAAIESIGLPAVVVGELGYAGNLPVVWNDDRAAMDEAVRYLVALGHRRIAHVAGPGRFVHTTVRREAFSAMVRQGAVTGVSVSTDYSGEDGARATRRVLADADPPSAVIYDNDVMALAGLGVAQELGLDVPDDLSIVAWDDSSLCQLVHPPLTTMSRDVVAHGTAAAVHLLDLLETGQAGDLKVPDARLVPRRSTAPHGRRGRNPRPPER